MNSAHVKFPSAVSKETHRKTLQDLAKYSVTSPKRYREYEFILDWLSSACPQAAFFVVFIDTKLHQGGVLHRSERSYVQLVKNLRNWTADKSREFLLTDPITELADLIHGENVHGATCALLCTLLYHQSLFSAIIWCLPESTTDVSSPHKDDLEGIEDALLVAMVLNHHRAQHGSSLDSLTMLPNREDFLTEIQTEIQEAYASSTRFVVMILDLDRFQLVNGSLGPYVADEILTEWSRRLRSFFSSIDLVARLGGDEFGILIRDNDELSDLLETGERLTRLLRTPIQVKEHSIRVTVSIGMAEWNPEMENVHDVIRKANMALSHVKTHGKNGVYVFNEYCTGVDHHILTIEDDLETALNRSEFYLVYQPKVCARTNAIVSGEALIRWMHPQRGVVLPSEFIPSAESGHLMMQIGEWVLEEVCRQLAEWNERSYRIPRIAMNVSPQQLVRTQFIEKLVDNMDKYAIPARQIEIEITETAVMEYKDEIILTIRKIRDMGVKVSVDDFGMGYSSLDILKRVTADYLKIDRSFVSEPDRKSRAIVSMIVQLAHSIDLQVVAEGVETIEQRDFLVDIGCDEMQGFLFSRPLPANEFISLFRRSFDGQAVTFQHK
ncbi:putative bifunctional diguanylate cyclase/phosphodiesterase [Alicyclobacillus mengziensis]|uniref:Bifunctional diguanylate cyclase/phosphodiesterase n=1 Tax=Alicyclobacillus mengziensis TaxID=2931921 RepID=A0A9X7Z7J7_9BACL|nr:bifunctional diguanylate cyclase/phosphodiesterase [Alicyclobacillus mengziensis]QSO47431.1 bifunctional diguanylate cyclase/phosphodiesterase [Alicyclobacillus mengziensis]